MASSDDSPAAARPSSVQKEIGQSHPFRSTAQEATIALLRTASMIHRSFSRVLEPDGLSHSQYNVLRILRGAGPDGLPTLEIRERMIDPRASITRLLDRLEARGLVNRERGRSDRRKVICRVTEDGRRMLDRLDPLVDATDEDAVSMLSHEAIERLVICLDAIRSGLRDPGGDRHAVDRDDDPGRDEDPDQE